MHRPTPVVAALAAAAAVAAPAAAQEALLTVAPTQPAAGHVVLRVQSRYAEFSDFPADADDASLWVVDTSITLGITGRLSLQANIPVRYEEVDRTAPPGIDDREDFGLGDASLRLKHRVWQKDLGPVDTARLSLFAGIEAPTATDDLGSDSWDPEVGAAFLLILGRHGLGLSGAWKFTTGAAEHPLESGQRLADELRLDAAYLYRLSPAAYASDTKASWYATAELSYRFETDGQHQLFLTPGILYEARKFAAELGLTVPVWQDVDERPELDWGLIAGVRFLF